jgi:hypothetical protein
MDAKRLYEILKNNLKSERILMSAQELREKHEDLDSEIFENAGLVIDEHMRTGGISVKGGTGLR